MSISIRREGEGNLLAKITTLIVYSSGSIRCSGIGYLLLIILQLKAKHGGRVVLI